MTQALRRAAGSELASLALRSTVAVAAALILAVLTGLSPR